MVTVVGRVLSALAATNHSLLKRPAGTNRCFYDSTKTVVLNLGPVLGCQLLLAGALAEWRSQLCRFLVWWVLPISQSQVKMAALFVHCSPDACWVNVVEVFPGSLLINGLCHSLASLISQLIPALVAWRFRRHTVTTPSNNGFSYYAPSQGSLSLETIASQASNFPNVVYVYPLPI